MHNGGLVVVAHADDEILFMGGTLIQMKDQVDWTIVCVTADIEHGRDPQFLEVCEALGAEPIQLGYEMGWKPHAPVWPGSVVEDLQRIVERQDWTLIYTHNQVGEYGHTQHRQVHDIMACFGREMNVFGPGFVHVPEFFMPISENDRAEKRRLADLYTRKAKALRCYRFFDTDAEKFGKHKGEV